MLHLDKMGLIWEKWVTFGKKRSHLEKWVTLGKIGHNWKNGSQLEKWLKFGKMGHS